MTGHRVVISIDPGFGGTGLAMFVGSRLYRFKNIKTTEEKDARYKDVASRCVRKVLQWFDDLKAAAREPDEENIVDVSVVIESPHLFDGPKGIAAAGMGAVFMVARLVGAIAVLMETHLDSYLAAQDCSYRILMAYPEPRVWKGQMSKAATKYRVLKKVKYATDYILHTLYKLNDGMPDHVFDAVGMGMWYIKEHSEIYNY